MVSVDLLAFGAFPYVVFAVVVIGSAYRYLTDRFSYSSLSSQFLENGRLFWGSVPWHYGILFLLVGHLIGFLFPEAVEDILGGTQTRLYTMESIALALGFLALFGLVALTWRRFTDPRIKAVTSPADVLLILLLLLQVITGIYTALFYRWGIPWYVHTAVPYLWSLLALDPQVQYVASLPTVTKLHIFNAFALVGVFPFTRLVHLVTFPLTYLWRPYQVVVWNRRK